MTDVGARVLPNEEVVPPPPVGAATRRNNSAQRVAEARVPPHDLAAEESLLGAMLLSSKAIDAALQRGVTAGDFYKPQHGFIYDACVELRRANIDDPDIKVPADPVTVADVLHRDGLLEAIGGPPTLIALQTGTPAISNASSYARIVVELSRLRTLINGAAAIADLAYNLPDDIDKAEAVALAHITNMRPRPTEAVDPYQGLDDFLETEEPDHAWIVPGLIEQGDRTIITAVAGHGKSTLLRQMGIMAASGLHPFTAESIDPVRVLMLDVENSTRQVRREIRPLREAAGDLLDPTMFRLRVYGQAIALADATIELDIAREIESYQPGIVVCGPLYKLITGKPIDEEPARAVADAIDRLRRICGSAFIIEAHSPYAAGGQRKREIRPYGASLWERWPEFGWYFTKEGDVEHWRGQREQRDWPAALQRSSPWPWAQRTAPDRGEWNGPTECIAAIIDLLELSAGEEISARSLESRLRAMGKSFRSETIREAAERAALSKQIDVRTGPRNARLYSIRTLPDQTLGDDF